MFQNIFAEYKQNSREIVIHLWDDKKGYITFPFKKYAYRKDPSGTTFSLFGDKVKKIYHWKKEETPLLYESDINPERRTLVDMFYETDDLSEGHTEIFLDLEMDITKGFPDWRNPISEITSYTIYDRVTDTYYSGIVDKLGKFTLESYDNFEIKVFQTEQELLLHLIDLIRFCNPSIISGWNSTYFDIPYLYNRCCAIVGQDVASRLSPIGVVYYNKRQRHFRIAGVSQLDYLELYKKFSIGERSSYKLDNIGDLEVGTKKVEFEGTLLDLYENDINKYLQYNINDVVILKKLDDKLKYIEIARAVCHKGHVPYEMVFTTSAVLDGALLTFLKRRGVVAPPKKFYEDIQAFEAANRIKGAYVKQPQSGAYKWIYDIDATSMYPNNIMSLNISPETKIGKVQGWDVHEYIKKEPKTYTIEDGDGKSIKQVDNEELKQFLQHYKCSISPNGILYRTDVQGLIPSILEEWFDERAEYKALRKKYRESGDEELASQFDIRQYVQKILLNSFYGVLGTPVFRFYDPDNGSAVTSTGREMIKFAEKLGNEYYANILGVEEDYCKYIDTDSLFFSAEPLIKKLYPDIDISNRKEMIKKTISVCQDFQKHINKKLDSYAKEFLNLDKHRFEFKQEVVAEGGFFITKKRYALWIVNDEGIDVDKLLVKGIDVVRSNFPPGFKNLLSDVLKKILASTPKDEIDQTVLEFKSKLDEIPINEIANRTGIRKVSKFVGEDGRPRKGTPAHVRSSINYNFLLKHYGLKASYSPIGDGEKIRWVYLKDNPLNLDKIAFRDDKNPKKIMDFIEEYYDAEKLFEQTLSKKLDTFYNAMKWAKAVDEKNTLTRFF